MITDARVNDALDRINAELGALDDAAGIHKRSRLSHLLRCMQRDGAKVGFCLRDVKTWRLSDPLPSPAEQFDRLILWLGEHQVDPAQPIRVPVPEVEAWIGARIHPKTRGAAFYWLSDRKEAAEFLENNIHNNRPTVRLTMAGWARYEKLKHGRVDSHKAFMAMKFNEPIVESAYSNCFKSAASRAGFDLFDLRDQQQAGMIDDQMRVAIRNSRFVVADLTHACRGSYWEGVIWDANELATAERQLTTIIRNTLPEEAKMDD
jgi:hypothetical protein